MHVSQYAAPSLGEAALPAHFNLFQSSPTSTSFYPNRQTRQNDRAAREVQLIRNHHLKAHWDLLGH